MTILDKEALRSLVRQMVHEEVASLQPPDEIMSKAEVAQLLGYTTRTIGNLMAREGLPFERRGHTTVVFRRSKVLEWHRKHGRKPLVRSTDAV